MSGSIPKITENISTFLEKIMSNKTKEYAEAIKQNFISFLSSEEELSPSKT